MRFFQKKVKPKNPRHPSPVNRKERSENRLIDLGIDYNPNLSELDLEVDNIRSPQEIACKVIATWEIINIAQRAKDSACEESINFLQEINLWKYLSPNEQSFLRSNTRDRQQTIDFSWKTEAVKTLYWAMAEFPSLGKPVEDKEVQNLSQRIYSKHSTIEDYLAQIKTRNPEEILDEADFYYRLHWSARPHRSKNTGVPKSYHYGVVRERDFALRWLTKPNEEWDSLSLDT